MAHIVRKKTKGVTYLYIEEIKLIKYVGREDVINEEQLKELCKIYNIDYEAYIRRKDKNGKNS